MYVLNFLPRDATQSAVTTATASRLSVRPLLTLTYCGQLNRLEHFENNVVTD